MQNFLTFGLLMASVGQLLLTLSLLALRVKRELTYLPLIVFFIGSLLTSALPAIAFVWPDIDLYGLAIVLPAFLIQPVALWFYVKALTSPSRWQPRRQDLLQLLPFTAGLLASAALFSLPRTSLENLFITQAEPDSAFATGVIIYAFVLILVWVFQSAVYLFLVFNQLARYRRQLKQVFTSTEQRELVWLTWLLLVVGLTWLLSVLAAFPDLTDAGSDIPMVLLPVLQLFLVWSFSVWGLRQKPGFADNYLDTHQLELFDEPTDANPKYQKSALETEQIERIKQKLAIAMQEQQAFLDPGLSLPRLAKRLQVPANYLSQTLNQALGETFFDYINRHRVEFAIPAVAAGQETILDIAMNAGFNARSSFYKAFKRVTGQTPSEYREAQRTRA